MNSVASHRPAFLGVERSLTDRRWIGPDAVQERRAQAIEQQTRLPIALCQILARCDVEPDKAEKYLQPKLRDLMPDPSTLIDLDKAVQRFILALDNRERIAILADYDVDGACSLAQIMWWLRNVGQVATSYVPDRKMEGFGPNRKAMKSLAKDHDLIICVDCGTSAHEAIAAAEGADVIVLDHHAGEETLPPAFAVVNPNRQDENSELVYLCAAGVVFMFLVALNREVKKRGTMPCDLIAMLDLVALATVADVSPLIGLNRAFVRSGLAVMRDRKRPGIRELADVSRLNTPPTSYHLGFVLGPRINAGGRIGTADLGARLLSTDDPNEARQLARKLDTLNSQRRNMVNHAVSEAFEQINKITSESPLVWAASKDWHPGIVGIVAARLMEERRLPAVVIAIGEKTSKGSARSIPGINIGSAVMRCKNEGLFLTGGGHKMAAGLEVCTGKLDVAMARLSEILTHTGKVPKPVAGYRVDGMIQPEAITVEFIETIEKAGPYGSSKPAPKFVLPNMQIAFRRWTADKRHLILKLRSETERIVDAILFGADQSKLGEFLDQCGQIPVHIVGQLQVDHFMGQPNTKVHILDAVKTC